MRFYLTGMLAYETARRLYEEERGRFTARFPRFFLEEFEKLSEHAVPFSAFLDKMCIEKNTRTLYSRRKFFFNGSIYVREVTEGGIFGTLWEACEDLELIRAEEGAKSRVVDLQENDRTPFFGKGTEVGCSVRLLDIPLDQHVIEILEYVGENPYEVRSEGCFLIAADEKANLGFGEITEIGTVTNGKERILLTGEKKRYLTPPERQAKDIEDRRGTNRPVENKAETL